MSLLNPLMVKNFEGVASVSLTPPSGKSLRVVDIVLFGLDQGITVKIEKTYVGFIAGGNNLLNVADSTSLESQYEQAGFAGSGRTLMRRLQEKGLPMMYPVAEGETFMLEGSSASLAGYLVYQLYDAGDVKNTEINGSASDHYIFINYGRPTVSIAPGDYADIDYPLPPTPFPNFPFGSAVPSGKKILFHTLLINAWGYNSYAGSADHITRVKYIKLIKDTESLFDRDMLGFYVQSAAAITGNANVLCVPNGSIMPYGYVSDSQGLRMFATPLEFGEGSLVHAQAYIEDVINGDSVPLTIPYLGIVEEVLKK